MSCGKARNATGQAVDSGQLPSPLPVTQITRTNYTRLAIIRPTQSFDRPVCVWALLRFEGFFLFASSESQRSFGRRTELNMPKCTSDFFFFFFFFRSPQSLSYTFYVLNRTSGVMPRHFYCLVLWMVHRYGYLPNKNRWFFLPLLHLLLHLRGRRRPLLPMLSWLLLLLLPFVHFSHLFFKSTRCIFLCRSASLLLLLLLVGLLFFVVPFILASWMALPFIHLILFKTISTLWMKCYLLKMVMVLLMMDQKGILVIVIVTVIGYCLFRQCCSMSEHCLGRFKDDRFIFSFFFFFGFVWKIPKFE